MTRADAYPQDPRPMVLDQALAGGDGELVADLVAIDESVGAVEDLDTPGRGPDRREEHLAGIWRSYRRP